MASIKVKQHDIKDCGAACLASIGNHYGIQIPIARIRQFAHTDNKGTNLLGMIEAAEKMGFTAKGVKGELDALEKIPLPAVAHIIVKNHLHHFVVIYEVSKSNITFMDPGEGDLVKLKFDAFKEIWTGVLILFAPKDDFVVSNQKVSKYSRFWQLINPHKGILTQALIGAIVYTILGLSTSIYVQKITDYVLVV